MKKVENVREGDSFLEGNSDDEAQKSGRIKPVPGTHRFLLNEIFDAKAVYILCGVLLFILLVLFSHYIFSNRLLLFKDIGSDSINFDWPARYYYSQYLRHDGIPKWTFAQGLGANAFPGAMGDAGNWLLFAVPPADMPYMFVYVEMLKIFLSGIFFFLFLRKINLSSYAALIGAALFAFSGFMTIGSVYAYFATEGCYLVFLLYSLELLRRDDNLWAFPLAIALAAANNFLLMYLHCLLLAAYLFFSFLLGGFTKSTPRFIGKIFLLGLLGLGMASFLMFGNINQMLESPRGSGNVSYTKVLLSQPVFKLENIRFYYTFLLRMFGNDMAGYATGKHEAFKGWYHYLSAPAQYCGLVSLLLFPQIFVISNRKLKWVAGIVLVVAVIPVIFSYFRYAFWLFSGDYFRTYSLFFSIVQILFAIKALDIIVKTKKVNVWVLLGAWVMLSGLVIILSRSSASTATAILRKPVLLLLSAEAVLIWLITKPRFSKAALITLPALVFVELIFLNWGTYNHRNTMTKGELTGRTGYNDSTVEAVRFLHSRDHDFYRLEKNYGSAVGGVYQKAGWLVPRSYNDAQMQDYYSSPSYYSFNNKYYINFLQKMHFITDTTDEKETRWIDGLGRYPLMMTLVSCKYLLLKEPHMPVDNAIFDSITQFGDVGLFKNRFSLPLGFTYSSCISETEMNKTGTHKQIMLFKAAVVSDQLFQNSLLGFNRLSVSDTAGTDSTGILAALCSKLRVDTLRLTSFSPSHITGNINTDSPKLMFLSIPYNKGWEAKIDGKKTDPVIMNYGFWGCIIPKGSHTVELTFIPTCYMTGMVISGLSILIFIGLGIASLLKKPLTPTKI